jgi:nickel/cobalt exporter
MLEPLHTTTSVLLSTAAMLAIMHTLLGIDHSLPFVVLGRARGWTLNRTLRITALCGVGHVASSVLIGALGALAGVTLESVLELEGARGSWAASLLIGFGLAYAAWAVWRQMRGRRHSHVHAHADGTVHDHPHGHDGEHLHPHGAGRGVTPWALFIVFVFGPCEPLIPLMVVPAVAGSWSVVAAVIALFGGLTVATMLAVVTVGYRGLALAPVRRFERHADLAAGLVVAASGAAVLLLGV